MLKDKVLQLLSALRIKFTTDEFYDFVIGNNFAIKCVEAGKDILNTKMLLARNVRKYSSVVLVIPKYLYEYFQNLKVQIVVVDRLPADYYELVVSRVDTIDYAHFIPEHSGKCKQFHAHSAEVSVRALGIMNSKTGMVVDFKKLKSVAKNLIGQIDHKIVVPKQYVKVCGKYATITYKSVLGNHKIVVPAKEVYVLPSSVSSVENISLYLAIQMLELLPELLQVNVVMSEGRTNKAECSYTRAITSKALDWVDFCVLLMRRYG